MDSIDGDNFIFTAQGGGDENNFARGAWDWELTWKRIPLNARNGLRNTYRLYFCRPCSPDIGRKLAGKQFLNRTDLRQWRVVYLLSLRNGLKNWVRVFTKNDLNRYKNHVTYPN